MSNKVIFHRIPLIGWYCSLILLFSCSLHQINAQNTSKIKYKSLSDTAFKVGDVITAPNIWFLLGNCGIMPEHKDSVNKVADFIRSHPNYKIEIGVHTDTRGNKEANIKLSKCRADELLNYLVQQMNIPAKCLVAKGYGGTQPKINERSIREDASMEEREVAHLKNKRTELKILALCK